MRFQTPLIPAILLRRYKRFLSECRLEDGREVVAHVANPGSMLGLAEPGQRIWLELNDDPRKKLDWAWRLVELPDGHFVGVDTGVPNRLLRRALAAGAVPGLEGYEKVRPEVRFGERSRVDFLLTDPMRRAAYVEVKSVTLSRQEGLAEFPDSVTSRGARHLAELEAMVAQGHRAVMLYVLQRTDCDRFAVAADLDPAYSAAFARAREAGVEALCIGCRLSPDGIALAGRVACLP
ncbi:DNA/RNA nuclease SfsA [Pseudoponticoccus marisrubri]|uniref:Sugar fermentation stimulation protein homolog n=1 Tax=Pseudoponticoccus marisrubri TaxID=1685382 RepID=A0A0W7WJI9_9RHOB|nr:DNA/RNA nuclease SfsA [Pseudoponticoccus marisrubri]KUF10689.1 sugar fermentation stimulation protein [Pseudoponticoccus marisrubri]